MPNSKERQCESDKANAAERDIVLGRVEIFPDVEPERLHSTDVPVESGCLEDIQTAIPDPEHTSRREREELQEKNGIKTTSSPESETSPKDQSSSNYSHEDSLDLNGNIIEETGMELTSREDHLEMLEGFNREVRLQPADETDTLEPPVKKRVRRRMGMCGLGDRKRKLPVDGQLCRQGLKGLLHRSLLENDGSTPTHHDGTACEENKEDSDDADVMDTERRTGEEEENSPGNMNDEWTRDEVLQGRGDVQEQGILEEKNGAVIMDGKESAGELVLGDHKQALLHPTIGRNVNMIQGEPSVPVSDNDLEKQTDGEPKVPGRDMFLSGPVMELNLKHEVLHEQDMEFNADDEPEEPGFDVQGPVVERSERPVTEAAKEAPTDLEESIMEIEEHSPTTMAENPNPHGPEDHVLSPEEGLDPLYIASAETAGSEKLATGVPEIVEPPDDDADECKGISEPIAPPSGQEIHLHSPSDQHCSEPPVNPSAFEHRVHSSTLPPAAEDLCVPSSLYSMTDSQLHKIALSMELEDEAIPEEHQEDATELVRGLVRELSSLNRTVMATHREMELLRRGKPPRAPNRRPHGPRQSET